MHFVKKAEYLGEYRVRLSFEDGSVRDVDLAPHLDGEIFEPSKDVEYFKTLRVEPDLDTIVWDNGADMSPDSLYEISKAVKKTAA